MAEREGFEPPIPVKVWLISSQLHSTGLCHLSARGHSREWLTHEFNTLHLGSQNPPLGMESLSFS